MSGKLRQYVATFNYIEKILIALNATTGWVCIISHATAVGAPIVFSLATGIRKELLKTRRNKKKKQDKIFMLAKKTSITLNL